jgi:2-hydroxychromene-2-carboxylate isomerase
MNLSVNPPPNHPFNPLLPLRLLSSDMDPNVRISLVGSLLDNCWLHGQDISDPKVVSAIATSCGLDGPSVVDRAINCSIVKDKLRFQTEEAVKLGVFGVPTTIVHQDAEDAGELFWGSERENMDFVDQSLRGVLKDVPADVLERWRHIKPSAWRSGNIPK